jgi:signal peptidase
VIVVAAVAWAAANLAVTAGGGRLFVVAGGSMEPTLPRGSLVVVRPAQDALAMGDVVTVRGDRGTYVTHRVTRTATLDGVTYLELRGDANPLPDPVLVPATAVVGRVDVVVPHAGLIQVALARPSGWAALLGGVMMCWMAAGLLRPPAVAVRAGRRATISAAELGRWPS